MQIFFPRSIEGEIAARDAARGQKRSRFLPGKSTLTDFFATRSDVTRSRNTHGQAGGGTYLLTSSPVKQNFPLDIYDTREEYEAAFKRNRKRATQYANECCGRIE